MEYKPSLPVHNDNVSHDQPIREFAILLSGCLAFALAVYWILGLCVDVAVEYISPEMETLLFSPLSGAEYGLADATDPQQIELQRLVDSLKNCVNIAYPVTVRLVTSEVPNAMAFPGGQIVVFSGLLEKVESENGLSFILAHELAHFTNRDHLRGIGRGIVLTALMTFLAGDGGGVSKIFVPSVGLSQARYSQERESLADEQALRTLNCLYGHVGGAPEFFEAMKEESKGSLDSISHYFASHPEAQERIDNLQQMVIGQSLMVKDVIGLQLQVEQ